MVEEFCRNQEMVALGEGTILCREYYGNPGLVVGLKAPGFKS